MTSVAIQTATVDIKNRSLAIPAYLAYPVGDGPFAAVIVIQEIFGVNQHIREVTDRLAREGYVAIAPALYHRFAPGFEAGYGPDDIQIGRHYKAQTNADDLLGDIQAAIDRVKALPQTKLARVGCIGFCFGGHVAYLAATLPDIKATASFYGAGITTMTPGGGAPTLSRTAAITGILYGFFGMDDASIPPAEVDQIEAELQTYGIPHRVLRYLGAGHGFFCDRRASHHPEVADDAWAIVCQLFHDHL